MEAVGVVKVGPWFGIRSTNLDTNRQDDGSARQPNNRRKLTLDKLRLRETAEEKYHWSGSI